MAHFHNAKPYAALFCQRSSLQWTSILRNVVLFLALIQLSFNINANTLDTSLFKGDMPGKYVQYFQENEQRLTIEQAQTIFATTPVKQGNHNAISLGIGVAPVWMRFSVNHLQDAAVPYRLAIETPWLDHIDTWLIKDNKVIKHIRGGDAVPYLQRPMQYRFYAFEHDFQVGLTEVYIRVESLGPMAIPLRFSRTEHAIARDIATGYQYGVLWGIMSALALYNLVLFLFIRQKEYGLYALYLIGFVLNSLSYTGHIHTIITVDYGPYFQDWTDITLMLTYSVAGLHFARYLLNTRSYAPVLDSTVKSVTVIIPCAMLLGFIFNQLVFAVVLAFILNSSFVILFIAMGISALKAQKPFAVIFLLSSVMAAICITVSTLAVAGVLIPYNDYTFKVIEVGMAIEAILLAVILARQFRMAKLDKIIAESYARTDALTGLNNRRGFYQITEPMWMTALREDRDLSVVLLDIDAFKQINDSYGHTIGDQVLVQVAQCIKTTSREGDVAARWGGEEFIIFLPETKQSQALVQAERLRQALQDIQITTEKFTISLTASLGVAGTEHGRIQDQDISAITLEQVVNFADIALYSAKNGGKNRVCTITA